MKRREAREQAFIIIFEKSFQQDCTVDDIIAFGVDACILERDDFTKKLADTVWSNIDKIDQTITPCLKGWKASRISKVAFAVLRMGVAEILYFEDIPVKVSINEAVELTKKYSTQEDASFVNGVLATVARQKAQQDDDGQLTIEQAMTQGQMQ